MTYQPTVRVVSRIDSVPNKEIQQYTINIGIVTGNSNTVAETNDFETIESGLRFAHNRIS